jgi:hypothetical protein
MFINIINIINIKILNLPIWYILFTFYYIYRAIKYYKYKIGINKEVKPFKSLKPYEKGKRVGRYFRFMIYIILFKGLLLKLKIFWIIAVFYTISESLYESYKVGIGFTVGLSRSIKIKNKIIYQVLIVFTSFVYLLIIYGLIIIVLLQPVRQIIYN